MYQSIEQILSESRTAITNALENNAIKTALAAYGYSEEKLQEGKALLETARSMYNKQIDEYGDKTAASYAMQYAKDQLNKVYGGQVKIAKVAFKNDPGASADLKISGARRRSHDAWLEQIHTFYTHALSNDTYKTALAAFGVTEDKLEEGKGLLTAAENAFNVYKKEAGEAQRATQKRDAAVDTLEDWMSDFFAINRVAFEDDAQTLEILGIVVKS